MINEKLIHSINLDIQNKINENYEYDNPDKLNEIVEIIKDNKVKKISFYNDPVGEIASSLLNEVDIDYYRLVNDYRISHSFAKKLFGLEKSQFEGKADVVICQFFSLQNLDKLFQESETVVLVSPKLGDVEQIDKMLYNIETKMFCVILTKKIRGQVSNTIINDEVQEDFDE